MNNNDDALIEEIENKQFSTLCNLNCTDSADRMSEVLMVIIKNTVNHVRQHDKTDWVSVDKALDLLSSDMHTFGIRPCSTCAVVSEAIGKPFGCSTRNGHRIPSPPKENS